MSYMHQIGFDARLYLSVDDGDVLNEPPWAMTIDKELGLTPSAAIRIALSIEPVPALHHLPVHAVKVCGIIVEVRDGHNAVAVREGEWPAVNLNRLNRRHEVDDWPLALDVTCYATPGDDVEHRRPWGEKERHVVVYPATRSAWDIRPGSP
jgi:hypothetical protein